MVNLPVLGADKRMASASGWKPSSLATRTSWGSGRGERLLAAARGQEAQDERGPYSGGGLESGLPEYTRRSLPGWAGGGH